MTKLIQRHEAAEMVGVTRQTIQNWIEKGVIKSQKIGNAVYVSIEAIKALAPDIKSIEDSMHKLQEEKIKTNLLIDEYKEKNRQLRADLKILSTCAESTIRKEFYLSIIDMLGDEQVLKDREQKILYEIMNGSTLMEISKYYGLTNERIRQISYEAIRKAAHLINLRDLETENQELKKEVTALKNNIVTLQKHISELEKYLNIEEEKGFDYNLYKLLVTPINSYNISVRSMNAITSHNIKTIGDLAKVKLSDVEQYRNIGKKSIKELKELLDNVGLYFGYDVDRIIRLHKFDNI